MVIAPRGVEERYRGSWRSEWGASVDNRKWWSNSCQSLANETLRRG